MPTAWTTRRDLLEVGEARRVDDVGAGIAVGDQPGDRVVEIVDAADVVLRASGQHQRLVLFARRLRRFRDALGRGCDVVHAARVRVVVLDREARGSGLGEQFDRPGDAARSRPGNSARCRRSAAGRSRPRASRHARRARRATRSGRACRATRRNPRSSSRAPRSRRPRAGAPSRRPTDSASGTAAPAHEEPESGRVVRRRTCSLRE